MPQDPCDQNIAWRGCQRQKTFFSRPESLPELRRFYATHRGFQAHKRQLKMPEEPPRRPVLSQESHQFMSQPGWERHEKSVLNVNGEVAAWTENTPRALQKQVREPGTMLLRVPLPPAQNQISALTLRMATPSSKSVRSEIPNTVRVDWNDVDLVAKLARKGGVTEEKRILSKVSGFALPGELLAIMGPSGAGKTSLLNCLAVRTSPTDGSLTFNATEISTSLKRRVAYVHQQEMLLECYTPKEHLLFQSSLRMPRDVTNSQRRERVAKCIHLLGLEKCQNSLIGDIYHGISKNEKRRVCFATEILTQPAVLFCDEPTTGLDSVMAEVIVKYMKAIAMEGQKGQKVTVIASIHQPSSQVFRLFDRLHFLVDGRTAFFGPVKQLEAYFSSIGYPMPDHTMPADFVMKLCINPRDPEGAASRRVAIGDAWEKQWPNDDARANDAPIKIMGKDAISESPDDDRGRNCFLQLIQMTKREVIMKTRSKAELRSSVIRTIVLGLIFGLTFFQIEKTQTALFALNGCIFFVMMMQVMNTCMGGAMGIPTRLPTLIREHRNGAYSVPSIYISKFLADLPFDFGIALLWSTMLFWMVGFRSSFENFFWFFLTIYLLTSVATGIGYLGGYVAPIGAVGMLVVLLNVMPQMMMGGLFINLDSVPVGLVWLKAISMFRHSFEALMINQWQDFGDLTCDGPCIAQNGEEVLAWSGINPDSASYMVSMLYLLIPLCCYHSLAFFLLMRRARPRQFEGAAPEDDTKGELRRQDEEKPKLTDIPRPELLMAWQNLTIDVQRNETGKSQTCRILDGPSGHLEPGQLMAIMGPSGSGKSTFLKSIAGISELPLLPGSSVNINGGEWTPAMRDHSGFLFQDEQLFAGLTVREHLLFQWQFRMGVFSKAESQQRVDALITELGLAKCKNTLIGNIGAGISGGERRRLAFATELLTEPSVLFADEATSGLDSAMAYNVCKMLRDFARGEDSGRKRTVFATIHQPSEEVFNLFDKVLILVDGAVVYHGSPSDALAHYESLGLACPNDESPADFFMRCVAVNAGEEAAREEARVNVKKLQAAVQQVDAPKVPQDQASDKSLKSSSLLALGALVQREFLLRRRSKILFKAVIARTLLMAVLFGSLYWQIPNNQASWQSIMGLLNMMMINTFMTAGFGLTQELPLALRPAFRESTAGMYSISAWFWSKVIGDFPVDTVAPFVLSSAVFLMTGIGKTGESYVMFVLLSVLVSHIGAAWGYLCSMIGGRIEYAFATFLLTIFPFLTFNGFLITTDDIPVYFRWIEVIGPFKPIFSEYAFAIWGSRGDLECPSRPCLANGDAVLSFFGLRREDQAANWAVIIGYLVGARLLAWMVLLLRVEIANRRLHNHQRKQYSKKVTASASPDDADILNA